MGFYDIVMKCTCPVGVNKSLEMCVKTSGKYSISVYVQFKLVR